MTDNEIIKAMDFCCGNIKNGEECTETMCYQVGLPEDRNGDTRWCRQWLIKDALDLINRQKAEIEKQSQNFKVLVSDHRTLQQSLDNLKGLYEAEKAKVEKAKEKCIKLAKELQTAKAELKETTEKFKCQQYVYTDLSDIIREKNAEIEKLKERDETAEKIIREQSSTILHLKDEVNGYSEKAKTFENVTKNTFFEKAGFDINPLAEIKAEAIEELLDKIEKQAIPNEDDVYWVELDDIYNLVKEMVGDTE